MGFRRLFALFAAAGFLIFSTLISWYEGARLLDVPWEWRHTAIFTIWMNGEVAAASEILAIDYFVYAAKFQPFFPFLMVSSALVLLFLIADWIFKKRKALMNGFLLMMAILFFAASAILAGSPTAGLSFFNAYFFILGILSLSYLIFRKARKQIDDESSVFSNISTSKN